MIPSPMRGRRSATWTCHRAASPSSVPAARHGQQATLGVVDHGDQRGVPEHGGRAAGNGVGRGLAVERRSEVSAQPAEQLALHDELAVALVLGEPLLKASVLHRSLDHDAAEESRHHADAHQVRHAHRELGADGLVAGAISTTAT